LKLLREAGLIDCERRGLWACYFVRREALAALRQRIVAQFDAMS
jgi:ArsR family transcriptional regulator, arsenate/arsenite/antimonite-responsive transcriptional repressor